MATGIEDLGAGISPKDMPADDDAGAEATEEEGTPGIHGRAILAAIRDKDPVALESAIKDCVEAGTY